jgi:TonB family protein
MKKRIFVIILFAVGLTNVVSAQKIKNNKQPEKPKNYAAIFRNPQEPARFPGCEEKVNEYRLGCSQQLMSEYIKSKLKYPKSCVKDSLEGMSFVSFVVDTNGVVGQIRIDKKAVSPQMDKEAIRIVKTFNKMKTKWVPAQQNGKKVMSELVIPVKFKIRKPKLTVAPPDEDYQDPSK